MNSIVPSETQSKLKWQIVALVGASIAGLTSALIFGFILFATSTDYSCLLELNRSCLITNDEFKEDNIVVWAIASGAGAAALALFLLIRSRLNTGRSSIVR